MTDPDPQSEPNAERIGVDVEDLIVGRRTEDPIHDARGVFLLAAGVVVTPELKRQLRSHDIDRIQLTRSDARRTTAGVDVDLVIESPEYFPETELTRRLDEIVDNEALEVRRGDQPLRERQHRRRHEFDSQMQEHLSEQHTSVCREFDESMQSAIRGETVSGRKISRLSNGYVRHLVNDSDLVLAVASEASDEQELADHALKTSLLSMALAIELGWGEADVRDVGVIATIQDWGMALVPREIRTAPRALDRHETFEMMKHPIYTVDLLARVQDVPRMSSVVAYQMHERIDGSGYPRGREERTIHPYAKVIQIADAYVAMTSRRSWRKAMMPYAALECLLRQAKLRQVDGRSVRALLHLMSLFPIGSFVALADGSVAQVVRRNGNDYTHPLVKRLQDPDGEPVEDRELIDPGAVGIDIVQALPTPGSDERRFEENLLHRYLRPPGATRNQAVVFAES